MMGFIRAPSRGTTNSYTAYQQTLTGRGDWLPMPRAWVRSLGPQAATLAAHLLGLGKFAADAGGYIRLTPSSLTKALAYPEAKADRIIGRLERMGILRTAVRGGERWVRLDTRRLDEVTAEDAR